MTADANLWAIVDPTDPYHHGRALWLVYGEVCALTIVCAKLLAYDAYHELLPIGTRGAHVVVWGYSVFEGVPGFRTFGEDLSHFKSPLFFDDQDGALRYLKVATNPLLVEDDG